MHISLHHLFHQRLLVFQGIKKVWLNLTSDPQKQIITLHYITLLQPLLCTLSRLRLSIKGCLRGTQALRSKRSDRVRVWGANAPSSPYPAMLWVMRGFLLKRHACMNGDIVAVVWAEQWEPSLWSVNISTEHCTRQVNRLSILGKLTKQFCLRIFNSVFSSWQCQ